jgi:hypothetical protein
MAVVVMVMVMVGVQALVAQEHDVSWTHVVPPTCQ